MEDWKEQWKRLGLEGEALSKLSGMEKSVEEQYRNIIDSMRIKRRW
jgi:hypothetical protein